MNLPAASAASDSFHSSSDRPTSGRGSTDNRNRNAQTGAAWGFVVGLAAGIAIVILVDPDEPSQIAAIIGTSAAVGAAGGTAVAIIIDDTNIDTSVTPSSQGPPSDGSTQDSSGGSGAATRAALVVVGTAEARRAAETVEVGMAAS